MIVCFATPWILAGIYVITVRHVSINHIPVTGNAAVLAGSTQVIFGVTLAASAWLPEMVRVYCLILGFLIGLSGLILALVYQYAGLP
jgi:hypothetical protein